MRMGAASLLILTALAACSNEAREVGPSLPQTPPVGNADPRIAIYQANFYQVAQGGRYFNWYGCSSCHGDSAPGTANLSDGRWRRGDGFADVYRAIAEHRPQPGYADTIPVEQTWQITAYVRDLPKHYPEKRRRVSLDQKGEPQGSQWSGPQ
jgi:mono/diheme cytochrome c family protein